jgi:hypothetical protein
MPEWLRNLFQKSEQPPTADEETAEEKLLKATAHEGFFLGELDAEQWGRLNAKDPELAAAFWNWSFRKAQLVNDTTDGAHSEFRYWEMVRKYAADSPFWYAIIPIFAYPLMLGARRIVEFGTAFTFYPKTLETPWSVSSSPDEGMLSTRILLAACKILKHRGIDSKLVSIEVRGKAMYEHEDITHNGDALFADLGLREYWEPKFGADSVEWLTEQKELVRSGRELPIDFALLDSNHTYALTKSELEGLAAIMSDKGVMIVDNAYTIFYEPNAEWSLDESPEGIRRGGKFGAVLEFVTSNSDWEIDWFVYPYDFACLRRKPQAKRGPWASLVGKIGSNGNDRRRKPPAR